MSTKAFCFYALLAASTLSPLAQSQQLPPPAPVRPVSDQMYGQTIVDPYRYMEDLQAPEVQHIMKAEADYTRSMLDALPQRQPLADETMAAMKNSPPRFQSFQRRGDRVFYMKRIPGEPAFKLYVRTMGKDDEQLVCDPATFAEGVSHMVLLSYQADNKGDLVTASLASGGSESAVIHVLDVATGKDHADRIPRDRFHAVSWLTDDSGFTYSQLQEPHPGMKPAETQQNSSVRLHKLGADAAADTTVVTASMLGFDPALFPIIDLPADSKYAVLILSTGVSPTSTMYVGRKEDVLQGSKAAWTKLADPQDGIYDFDTKGDEIFMVAGKGSPNFRVLRLSMAKPDLKSAKLMVPEQKDAFVSSGTPGTGVMPAADALYVVYVQGGSSRLGRIGYEPGSKLGFVPISTASSVDAYEASFREPGVLLTVNTWTAPPVESLANAQGAHPLPFTAASMPNTVDVKVEDVEVTAKDGAKIPLTILYPKDFPRDGSRPLLLSGYGAYGISESAAFSASRIPWLARGYAFAIAHVRGGGERGEAWHLAGYKETKHNTWEDTIACAEYLIHEKYTSASHLGLIAGSAGGILAGRSLEERPDLFAAVIDAVPMSDVLQLQRDPNGPDQKAEFGWFDTEAGFRALMAMSSYHHTVEGTKYPAVLFITGANDPRVSPSQPMKMTARLRAASGSGKPILLRVDYDAGHNSSTMTLQQQVSSTVDYESFILWQAGVPGFQPSAK